MTDLSPRGVAIRWFQEVWNLGDKSAIKSLMGESAIGHLEGGLKVQGPGQFCAFHSTLFKGFPDLTMEILHVVADDSQACVHWMIRATHRGEAFGVQASGRTISASGMTLMIVREGKIVEGWDCWNQGAMLAELARK